MKSTHERTENPPKIDEAEHREEPPAPAPPGPEPAPSPDPSPAPQPPPGAPNPGPMALRQPEPLPSSSYTQPRTFANTTVVTQIKAIPATTNQKRDAWVKSSALKFIPITPAISEPGRKITEARVRILTILFVLWPVRAMARRRSRRCSHGRRVLPEGSTRTVR